MTRESIEALLPSGTRLSDCAKAQCEVEVGRRIGADYIVTGEEGPDHQKAFKVDVVVAGQVLGRASGRAKKQAEQEAARLGLEALDRAQSSSESAGGSSAPGESGR